MKKILSFFTVLLLGLCLGATAQTRLVVGRALDKQGKPAEAVTVQVKNGSTIVAADNNGSFKIQAKTGDILIFSGVNFISKEIKLGNETSLAVTLDNQSSVLDEVVVTALGIKRNRNQLPYSAQQVTGEEVSKGRASNFVNGLSGKVAGLELRQTNTLGGSTNVILRGSKSLTGNNQALFVVDGVPYDNSSQNDGNQRTGRGGYDYGSPLSDINPDDIASITVLKGAASTALYGSRGSNGVILITTKKGAKGLGITINTGFSQGTIDKSTFATYQKKYGGGYGQYYEDPSGFFLYRDINNDGIPDLVDPTSEDASYGAAFDPTKNVYQWDAFDPSSANYLKPRPWVAAANDPVTYFEKPVSLNNSIFIDGGGDKGSFKLGYTRNDDKGILPNSKIIKNALNFSSTYNVTDKLVVSATVNYTKTDGTGRYGTGYDSKNPATNFRQWWQVNNDLSELKNAYFRTKKNVTWNWTDPTDLTPIYWDNPYWVRYESYESDTRNRIFANATATYKITNWLNVLARAAMDGYDQIQEERIAAGSIDVPLYKRNNRSVREYNYDIMFNVDKKLTNTLTLKGLLGANLRKNSDSYIIAETNGGLIVPRVYSLSNSKNTPNAPIEYLGRKEVNGVFAGATLSYKNLVTIDGTIRRDQSSTLPQGNNIYYYPSVSGSFTFSNLMKEISWLSSGKMRANYAEVGADAPIYSTTDVYNVGTAFGSQPIISAATTKNNPNLVPERTKSYEIGLDMSFLKGRLGFDVSYYNAKTINQILPITVSRATGYNSTFVNAGSVENKGIEVSLFATPVQTKDFSWNLNINWSQNRNKVVELAGGNTNLLLATFQGGVSLNASLGEPYGTIRGSSFVYTNGEKTVGANGRYLLSATSNEVIGNPNPDWIGGIQNTFKYKDFALGFLIDVRQGGQLFSLDMNYGLATGLYPETAGLNDLGHPLRDALANGGGIIRPGVTADGKPNTKRVSAVNYGAYGYRYAPAADFIYDASYVKLREVNITYSLPQKTMEKLAPFKGISFSLVGRNLWIISKKLPYSDPEETVSSGNLQGYQGGAYPTTRNIGFNIKLRF
ncbi:MAG: SusC/RagA family TonB-linked outer membrane protein [Chitinophagaceae bacterium]|nr:SusC/RagA family TonB-linked outer membrane protein [Chitinophagaceae bacterium]